MFYEDRGPCKNIALFEKVSEDIQDRGIYPSALFFIKKSKVTRLLHESMCDLKIYSAKNSIACENVKVVVTKGPSLIRLLPLRTI